MARATITFSETVHAAVQRAAEEAGLSVPDYLRRALALQRALDRYIIDDSLTVLDPGRDGEQVHLHLATV